MRENPKILLAIRRSLGDAILLTSVVRWVRAHLPHAEVSVMVPPAYMELFKNLEGVRELLPYKGFLSLLWQIRSRSFDYFLDFYSSGKNIWLVRCSGVKEAHFDPHTPELGHSYPHYPNALEWHQYFLERVFGRSAEPSLQALGTSIMLTTEEKARAAQSLRAKGFESGKVVFLGTGASRRTKRWPARYFAQLAELLRDRHELAVALAPGHEQVEQEFSALVLDELRVRGFSLQKPGEIYLSPPVNLRELAALLSQCRAYVGNDSGPKHLAAAVGISTLTFFGPEDPGEWHPYDRKQHRILFQESLKCRSEDSGRWCGISECVVERHRCMEDMDPYQALAELKTFLGNSA